MKKTPSTIVFFYAAWYNYNKFFTRRNPMTLKQLLYIVTVAETGNITEAAKKLFLAQPSLTTAIHSLEEEYGITIFSRSNKGIELTPAGDELLGYARQILEQVDLMNERYIGPSPIRHHFCVSSQHYSFAVEAFVKLVRQFQGEKYEFHMRETQTYDIIDDVAHMRSEIGILYRNKFNRSIITKTLKDNQLTFTPLFTASPHVFLSKNSPLAQKSLITRKDLKPFPRLSYEQGSHNSFYFSEEILSTEDCDKKLIVCDRATLFNMLIGLNGYTICSGVISEELNGTNIIARPLDVEDYMEIGFILPKATRPSRLTMEFIEILTAVTTDQTKFP